ncbi:M16 family metallopeptidase [Shewanella septentrionalis]|uniref:Insulinase family protein n=1 Tax=Shewanella septentrionalis TaxID=2952223 RepID=A0A9X2WY28_9GAMM|nr:M16 family metallopeptidase [Shewanella septentrionalis]MCT7947533.1 insulinase family protein [Shewanella septentrionalis]
MRQWLLLTLLTVALPLQASEEPLWMGTPDLPMSGRIHTGELANGMRYLLVSNKTPEQAVIVRMRVDVGSVVESDTEQGLVHFLEHMAFNGSTGLAAGEMIPTLQRLGLSFGADTNAVTEFQQTVYQFNLPSNSQDKVDTALFLMREIGSNLLLDPALIEREKAVVLAELRERSGADLENYRNQLQFLMPQTLLSKRFPVGEANSIKNATREALLSLYQGFYTPSRTTLIVVGDIEVAAVEQKIKQQFTSWQAAPLAAKVKPQAIGTVAERQRVEAAAFFDPSLSTSVSLGMLKPMAYPTDSPAVREQEILLELAHGILYRRMESQLLHSQGLSGVSLQVGEQFDLAYGTQMSLGTQENNWQEGIAILEQTLRQAKEFGFSQQEIDQQIKRMHKGYQLSAAGSSTIHSVNIADGLVYSVAEKRVPVEPEWQLAFFEKIMPTVTPQKLKQVFNQTWNATPYLYLTSNKPIENVEKQLVASYEKSRKQAVSAPAAKAIDEFAYTEFGDQGKLNADNRDAETGIRQLQFANGVRLNLKPTDFNKGTTLVSLNIGFGEVPFPELDGLSYLFNSAFVQGGLKAHDYGSLQDIFAGQDISINLGVREQSFGGEISTNAAELRTQLSLMTAFLIEPGMNKQAEQLFREQVIAEQQSLHSNPQTEFSNQFDRISHSGDKRYGYGEPEEILKRQFAELAPSFHSAVEQGAIEIAIVGDFDEASAITAVAETLGAIKRSPTEHVQSLVPMFPKVPAKMTLTHYGHPDSAALAMVWPTTDMTHLSQHAGLGLLEQVLSILLTENVREKAGASYSPSAFSYSDFNASGYGYLGLFSVTTQAMLPTVAEYFTAAVNQVKQPQGISEDLLNRARQPVLEWMQAAPQSNGFWLDLASNAQSYPGRFAAFKQRQALAQKMTPAELSKLAQQYLPAEGSLTIQVLPAPLTSQQ